MSLFDAPLSRGEVEARYGAEPEMIYVLGGGLTLAGVALALLLAFVA